MQTLTLQSFNVPTFDKNNNWNVVLHEDPNLTSYYVICVLTDVFGYSYITCEDIVQQVIDNGKAIVKTTNKQLALHYQQQLEEQQLTVTIEETL